jgi:hypothetical protein
VNNLFGYNLNITSFLANESCKVSAKRTVSSHLKKQFLFSYRKELGFASKTNVGGSKIRFALSFAFSVNNVIKMSVYVLGHVTFCFDFLSVCIAKKV